MNHGHHHQTQSSENETDTSAESAALVRSASRTAASTAKHAAKTATTTTRGAMAGRLPTPSSVASTTASHSAAASRTVSKSMPRASPRLSPRTAGSSVRTTPSFKVPKASASSRVATRMPKGPKFHRRSTPTSHRLARASDRASMGWDVLSAGQELQSETTADGGTVRQENRVHTQQLQQQHQHQHEHQQQSLDAKSSWASFKLPSLQQITTFGRIFITNAILGMAVFSMYEGMIEYFDANPSIATETEEIDNNFKTREQLNDNTAYATISASQSTKISIIDKPSLHHPSTSTNAGIEEDVKIQCDNSSSNYTTITRVQKDNTINLKNDGDATYSEDDAMERASIAQHLVAGALGGATHAILSLALESNFHLTTIIGANTTAIESVGKNHGTANYLRLPQYIQSMISFVRHSKHNVLATAATVTATNTNKPTFLSLQFPSMNYATSSILHHSIAHSMLFGSYQFTKRSLFHLAFTDSEHTMATKDLEEDAATLKTNRDIIHATTIAAAGGFAGQIQHVTSHFTEQWFGLGDVMVDNGHRRSLSWNNAIVQRLVMVSWPSWRSTMMAFPPSAVGFLAFEYGKLMMMGEETLDGVS